MAEEQPLPDWLSELKDQQPEQQPQEEPHLELGEGPQENTFESLIASMQDQPPPPDMVGDLREQMILPEDEFDYEERPSSAGLLPGMKPWQGFILALLLFVNVAVLGCLALLVTGRIMLPF
jgi:hypothetical protein